MNLRYLLDTNILIYIRKQKPQTVLTRLAAVKSGEVAMSVVTYGELIHGAEKSMQRAVALATVAALRDKVPVLDINDSVGNHYGQIRGALESSGNIIGNNDLWIAAHARAMGLCLITNNMSEFKRVPDLKLDNWV